MVDPIDVILNEYGNSLRRGHASTTVRAYKTIAYKYLLYVRGHYVPGRLWSEYTREYLNVYMRKHTRDISSQVGRANDYLRRCGVMPEDVLMGREVK